MPLPRKRSCPSPPVPERIALSTELLVLPDGRIFVHDLTPGLAALLNGLNPDDQEIKLRVGKPRTTDTERPTPRDELCPGI